MCVAISMIEPCFLHRVIRIVMDSYGNRSLPTLCHVAHSRPIMRHYRRDNVNASLFLSQIGNGEDREYLGNQGTSRRGSRFGVSQLKSDSSCRFHDRKVVRRRPCKCYCSSPAIQLRFPLRTFVRYFASSSQCVAAS